MISRVNIVNKSSGLRKIQNLNIFVIDSYIIDANLSDQEVRRVAETLTNPRIENYSINAIPNLNKYTFVFEIGYLPGVTDNVAHTVKESLEDTLGKKIKESEGVYTSKLFCVSLKSNKKINISDIEKISKTLYNQLIERCEITEINKLKKGQSIPTVVPVVRLEIKQDVINVSLDISDQELIKLGKEGVVGPDGIARGPLALDLTSMKVIQAYFTKLKRDPTDIELESLAQTWSEHCKHTIFANPIDDIKEGLYKTYIKGATNLIRKNKKEKEEQDICVSVFSDNAGGIIFDENYVITHKVETHNSPSALDPFGGAITGIVGVNRDTIGFGMGAKPVANTYGFCFGDPEDKRLLFRDKNLTQQMLSPKRIMDGVIKGVNVGGNCSGIPTVSGFTKYDDRFRGKPLVFVGTVGLIPKNINSKSSHVKAAKKGDYIVVVGGKVGADGIHGATFSSVVMDSNSPATAVQIGDPITQKKLSDAIAKEARDKNLYNSITDNGAGGISCSVAEMAKECGGAIVDIEKVPLKYPGLSPWQIWISESQERMTLSVPKNKWEEFNNLMESRGVLAVRIGEFTDSTKCIVKNNGEIIMDMEMEFLHNGLPLRQLETEKFTKEISNPKIIKKNNYNKDFLSLIANKNIASSKCINQQYDHEVQAGSVLKPLTGSGNINSDAQVFRPVLNSQKVVVLSSALYPSYSDINTYKMAAAAIDTAIRNVIVAGGKLNHTAILDNFCWCSSYDKKRLYELVEAVRSCYDTAVGYQTPFISGKDSMFNDFKGYDEKGNPVAISIPPTLVISAISVMPDKNKTVSPEFKFAGDQIYILGETYDELGGSEYFKILSDNNINKIGINVPNVNIVENLKTYKALEMVIEKELVASSISLHSGGLAIAIAKASIGGNLGAEINLKQVSGKVEEDYIKLFSESMGRVLVSVAPKNVEKFEKLVKNIICVKVGKVTSDKNLVIRGAENKKIVEVKVSDLTKKYQDFSNTQAN